MRASDGAIKAKRKAKYAKTGKLAISAFNFYNAEHDSAPGKVWKTNLPFPGSSEAHGGVNNRGGEPIDRISDHETSLLEAVQIRLISLTIVENFATLQCGGFLDREGFRALQFAK